MPSQPALFIYGTLLDEQLLGVVLGRRRPRLPPRLPARLPGYRCVRVQDAPYPVVIPVADGTGVSGALLTRLTDEDWGRLWFYESDDYALVDCSVVLPSGGRREAVVFAGGTTIASEGHWTLGAWRLRHRRAALPRIRRRMRAY